MVVEFASPWQTEIMNSFRHIHTVRNTLICYETTILMQIWRERNKTLLHIFKSLLPTEARFTVVHADTAIHHTIEFAVLASCRS